MSALTLLSEVGNDMSKWPTEHHFTSWLGLAPNTKESGCKIISSRIMKKKGYAGQAFRMAANSLYNSQTVLGNYFRRIRAKAGPAKAIVATARKIAIIYYKMIAEQTEFNPECLLQYQEIHKKKRIKALEKQLDKLRAA